MSTQFTNRQWRLPNNENKEKQSNYSMDFDGTGGVYITAGDSNSLSGPYTGYTISAWAKTPVSWESDYNAILSKKYSFYFGLNTNHYLVLNPGSGTAFAGYEVTSTTALNLDTWYHFLVTADGTNVKLYINGILDKTQATTNTAQNSNTSNTPYIGGYSNAGDFDTWKGQLDAICFFNYALTDGTGGTVNQISALYGSSSTGIGNPMSLNPVAFYQLGDKSAFNGANYLVPNIAAEEDDGDIAASYSPFALSFDGTNEKIEYANGTIDLGLSSTETWWIKYSNSSANSASIASAPVLAVFHILYEKSTNKVYYRIDSTNLYYEWVIPSTYFTDNLWHHYAIVRDDSLSFSSYIKLYIDGNLFGSPTAVNATTKSTTNTKITDWGGASAYAGIVAHLSNIAVWNISLSSTEITEIFNSGVPSNLNNFSGTKPYSWWQLGSNMSYNSNWTVLDEGTGNNNGDAFNISEDSIVDGVGSYANGLSSGMGGDEVIGDAPYSTANSLSVNMDVLDRVTDTPS